MISIVPLSVKLFAHPNAKLPPLTQSTNTPSTLLRHNWYIIFPLFGAVVWGILRGKKTERGRQIWDRFKLRVPMKIGEVVRKVTMARFSRTLATLVGAGVDIVTALEITGTTAGNWV